VRPWHDLAALIALKRCFRRERPDLVHTHSGKAGFVGRLAARWAGVPLVVHTIHGPSFGSFQGTLPNLAYRAAERLAGRVTNHFVTVSHAMSRQYLAAGIGIPDQYTRILSGFDLQPFLEARNDFALRAALGFRPDDVVAGTVARLFELKGHDELLGVADELCRQCPNLKFLWVGDGPWRERLQKRAIDLGLAGRVVFAGLVEPSRVPSIVGVMDLLVHLSRREGLPRALPQALAAGKPVLAWDCDGAGEVCLDGQTGFLVPTGDLRMLKERLLALARDQSLRARLGLAGRNLVAPWFSEQRMVDDLHALYLRLAQSAGIAS
jgi:glycosyltransferase involved in cell wall biosynthesis